MKRDTALVTKLLTAIEQDNSPEIDRSSIKVEGYEAEIIGGHLKLLIDAGLVIDDTHQKFDMPDSMSQGAQLFLAGGLRLSWAGHDYLDNSRTQGAA